MKDELLKILYQDDDYVAIHKPSGLLVHRSPIDKTETRFAVQLLRNQLGRHVFPCHRIDKPTSGVLLFALSREAIRAINSQFMTHSIQKTYRSLVRGWLDDEGLINHPLKGVEEGGELRGGGEPQSAVTRYRCLNQYELPEASGRYSTSRYSLVELYPETGRTHQLRRHMKHISHHIVGDTRYGDGRQNQFFRERFACHRLMLVATQLAFTNPHINKVVSISTDPDEDFRAIIDKLPLRA